MDAGAWIQINYVVWAKKMTWKRYLTRSRIGISPHWMWLWPIWLSWRKEFSEMSKLCLRLSYHQVDCRLEKFNSKIMHSKVLNKHAARLSVFRIFTQLHAFCILLDSNTHTIINFYDFPHLHGYLDPTLIRCLSTLTSPWDPKINFKFLLILKYYFAHLLTYGCLFLGGFGWIWLKVMIRIVMS